MGAAGGIVVGGRAGIYIDIPMRNRSGLILGGRAALQVIEDWVAPLETISFDIAIHPSPDLPYVTPEVEFAVALGNDIATVENKIVDIEFRVAVRFGERYVGPGSGIVTDTQFPFLNRVREGDRFPTLFKNAGVDGLTGVSHVMSRSADSTNDEQDIEVQPVIPDDPRNIATNRRGENTIVRPAERGSLTRQVARERRERIRENRRRKRRER